MTGVLALDANALKAVQEYEPAALRSIEGDELALPCVALEECLTGWHLLIDRFKRQQDELRLGQAYGRLCELHEFTRDLALLHYTPEAQSIYTSLRKVAAIGAATTCASQRSVWRMPYRSSQETFGTSTICRT